MGDILQLLQIEDDEDDHVLLKLFLEDALETSYSLTWSQTGKKGRQYLETRCYDIVFIGAYLLPEPGIGILRDYVHHDDKPVFILLGDANSLEEERCSAQQAGAYAFLVKEYLSAQMLRQLIMGAMARRVNTRISNLAQDSHYPEK